MRRLIGIVLASLALGVSHAQDHEGEEASSTLSRPMRMAITSYEKGDDLDAMDGFMDILTKGDPAERSMANEYINLITHRMNTGIVDPKSSVQPPALPRPAADPASPPPAPPIRPAAAGKDGPLPAANKALMKKEIKAKIRAALEKSLKEIKSIEDVRVVMQENGNPRAIGIPSPLLFSSGIAFHKTAGKLLDSLTRLAYSLGSTKVMLLPEGAAIGDAKVLDMRRTMGVSAHFFSAGIAPPRVKVNLLNNQVDIPKALQDFKGIVIVFVYNEPLSLTVESALGDEAGPPLSLGVYPSSFRPDRNEGVIIEFSVSDPPAGLVSWKFQLLQPSAAGGDLAPLQEVVGGGPVFHQIYWNGRQNYFGPFLPAGRYECVLTATDAKNRQRTLHKWIQLMEDGNAGAPPAAASAGNAAVPARRAPAADLDGPVKAAALITAFKPEAAKGADVPRAKKSRAPLEAAAEAPKPAPNNYELPFNKGTHQLAPEGEKLLAKVAETVSFYPLEGLKLIGYANPSEPDTASLAERRAQMVAGLLINKYQVEPKKIQVSSKVGEEQAPKVEVYFVGNE